MPISALRTDSKTGKKPKLYYTTTLYVKFVTNMTLNVAAIVGFTGSFRIARGEKYNPMLKLNTSMVFREKEQKYKNIVSNITIMKRCYETMWMNV